jgi:acyl-[acyl-carrier-protein]-phospholipid O-acyltransferase / long-chain-fatty-acid--[acyl-carrier-protein] ligase
MAAGSARPTFPLAGLAMSGFLFLWVIADRFAGSHLGLVLTVVTSGIGIAGGIYSVPLYALMQHRSPKDQRGRVISANNIMNAASWSGALRRPLRSRRSTPKPAALLGVLGVANLAVSIYMVWLLPESVLQTLVRLVLQGPIPGPGSRARKLPRRRAPPRHRQPHLVARRGAAGSAFLPEAAGLRRRHPGRPDAWVKPFLKWTTAHSIDPLHPLSLKTLCAAVEKGGLVAIFPEGRLTTTGGLMKVYDGAGFIAQKTGASIVTVHIDGAHLSVFTRLAGTSTSGGGSRG